MVLMTMAPMIVADVDGVVNTNDANYDVNYDVENFV